MHRAEIQPGHEMSNLKGAEHGLETFSIAENLRTPRLDCESTSEFLLQEAGDMAREFPCLV